MLRFIDGEYKSLPGRMPERSCCFSVEYYENYIEEMREVVNNA